MSIHSLPPELLLDIFRIAVHRSPDANFWECRDNSGKAYRVNLRSIALVHPSWSPLAQSLLVKSIWLSGVVAKDEKLFAALQEEPFVAFSTFRLYCYGKRPSQIEEVASIERFRNIQYLRMDSNVTIHAIAKLPRLFPHALHIQLHTDREIEWIDLETMHLESATFDLGDDTEVCLPTLKRLVFVGYFDVQATPSAYASHFSRRAMPELAHLALDMNMKAIAWRSGSVKPIIQHLLPLVRSLALIYMEEVQRSPVLEHLSLELGDYNGGPGEDPIFAQSAPLHLKSLHLGSGFLHGEGLIDEELVAIAEGKHQSVQVDEIVLHGSRKGMQWIDCADLFLWVDRGDPESPIEYSPFADFDGGYRAANLV